MNVVYVTGNVNKAAFFSRMVGIDIEHTRVDVEEIQSLDLVKVVKYKAKEAYRILKKPVIVEDTQLQFEVLGRLPGPLIKWFLEELGNDGLCRLLENQSNRNAYAGAAIAFYDGSTLEVFESSLKGTISHSPGGESTFGWNVIFIPQGANKTLAEMDNKDFQKYYSKLKPFSKVRTFLEKYV